VAAIPYHPRRQFELFHERKERFAVCVCHRRAGKTLAAVCDTILKATKTPNGRYAFIAPYYHQAKLAAWDYLKQYTEDMRPKQPNESELKVELWNGSTIRLFGADNPDSLRGAGFDGVVLDEYAQCRPSVWGQVIRPALADRQGWATFIGTPQGRQGLYDIWNGRGQWEPMKFYRLMLPASQTDFHDSPITRQEIDDLRLTLTEDEYAQEFECSFEAAIKGSVYGKLMAAAETDERITSVPYDPAALVVTSWDVGIGDPTAIWFSQTCGRETHLIDYYEASGHDIAHYASIIRSKPYSYAAHILPHDAEPKELSSGRSIKEVLESLKVQPVEVQPLSRIEDGINAARLRIPMAWFDAKKCERGIEALRLYRYEYDEKLSTFRGKPVHDWTSHAADSFRYLCEGLARGVALSSFDRELTYPDPQAFV